mmetsp:Transcript_51101/g.76334  ORF Transcript_51101/g.76334 Transcript_51101/m.76334 type:complete len:93 (+) Transcript_51101:318-596(+)
MDERKGSLTRASGRDGYGPRSKKAKDWCGVKLTGVNTTSKSCHVPILQPRFATPSRREDSTPTQEDPPASQWGGTYNLTTGNRKPASLECNE